MFVVEAMKLVEVKLLLRIVGGFFSWHRGMDPGEWRKQLYPPPGALLEPGAEPVVATLD